MKWTTPQFYLWAVALALLAFGASAQTGDETHVANSGGLKFGGAPYLPSCLTMAPEHGDPGKGAFTLMLKFTSGCTVPMHWHSSGEEMMLVSGSGKMQMQDGKSTSVERGGFAYIAAKHQLGRPYTGTSTIAAEQAHTRLRPWFLAMYRH